MMMSSSFRTALNSPIVMCSCQRHRPWQSTFHLVTDLSKIPGGRRVNGLVRTNGISGRFRPANIKSRCSAFPGLAPRPITS